MLGFRIVSCGTLLAGLTIVAACTNDNEPNDTPPAGLSATATSATAIHLAWTAASGATQYVIERATGAAGAFAEINRPAAGATTFDDTGLLPSTQYRYHIAAVRSSGTSAFSTEVSTQTNAAQQVNVTTDITTNTTWTAGNIYKLVGFRKVASGATLTIEAGTKIIGDFATLGS